MEHRRKDNNYLLTELKILAYNKSNYLLNSHDTFIDGYDICIVTKLSEKGDLKRFIDKMRRKNTNIKESLIWNFLIQLCLGVHYLHSYNIIHRDLKTANIFINKDLSLIIGDFGVSKILKPHYSCTDTQIGTPYYISPEIIEGKEYTYHTDIYSLGCLFCEIYKNKLPYTGNNLYNLYYNVMNSKHIINFNNSTLDTLIQSMINKSYINRPTIQELIEKFNNYSQFKDKINLFKKDKFFSSKIKQKYTIPTDWQYFINVSINKNNLLPNI